MALPATYDLAVAAELADVQDTLGIRSALAPYVGLACNNLPSPGQVQANNSINTKIRHYARTKIKGMGKARLPWFFISAAGWEDQTGLSGTTTVALAIEYPAGVFTPLTFQGGSSTGTITTAKWLWTDLQALPTIPEGATFWTHSWASTTGSNILLLNRGSQSGATSGGATFTNGQANRTTDSSFVPSSPHIQWGPDLIVCTTTRPTFFSMGDSREISQSGFADQTMNYGIVGRSLGPNFGITTAAVAGGNLTATDSDATKRSALLDAVQYASHFICQLGYNDRNANTALLGPIYANLYAQVKAANPNIKIGQCTIFSGAATGAIGVDNTGLSSSGTTATVAGLPQKAIDQLRVGQTVRVAGVTPPGYNGDVAITAISGATYSYTLPAGGSGLAASTVHGKTFDMGQSSDPTIFRTPAPNLASLAVYNKDIRQGVRANQDFFIDHADFFDYGRDLGFTKPCMFMPDDVHPNGYGETALAASGAVLNSIPGLYGY